ncbi:hypothetical protein CYMTET_20252, partial [Cymbomonas tetramitiformis]
MENVAVQARVMTLWCSWCYKRAEHELKDTEGFFPRKPYECRNCKARTMPCRAWEFCCGATRGGLIWDEQLCAACDGKIVEWAPDSSLLAKDQGEGASETTMIPKFFTSLSPGSSSEDTQDSDSLAADVRANAFREEFEGVQRAIRLSLSEEEERR